MVSLICVCTVYYLNLLSAQHCHFPHVPERLKQVVVELSGRLQQHSVCLILLGVDLQQFHHAVHGFVFVQHLQQYTDRKDIVRKPVQSETHKKTKPINSFVVDGYKFLKG